MNLTTYDPDTPTEILVEAVKEDGAAIIRDVIDIDTVQKMTEEVQPYIDSTPMGGDDFAGRHTQRTGALVARTPTCRDLVMDERILDTAKTFLAPYTDKIILHLTQTIYIHPGSQKQPLHRDRLAWGNYIPKSIEPQFNTIWALTDFTTENGATRCVPGSNHWDWQRRADPDQVVQAEMSAGSVFLYSGSVLHSGGENSSDGSRLGLNITYTLGWLRQEENQYLSCPPHIAKDLDPELQALLGYTQGNYALGYFSDPENQFANYDLLPPEMALGRTPKKGSSLSEAVEDELELKESGQL
ncbi:MAG: phytanoyl-CoA dioxygenase family protein [Pseudomonadota bacterium]|nr:phytanoyl-CoA dioxygenase family protein [Pseudomonadota bacterium]